MMKRPIFLWMGLMVLFLLAICQVSFANGYYKVKPGDTLNKISKKYRVNIQALKEVNNLKSNALKRNQVLVIPQKDSKKKIAATRNAAPAGSRTYVVKKGDNLSIIAKKTGYPVDEIKKNNHLRRNALKVGQKLVLSKPASGMETVKKAEVRAVETANTAKLSDEEYLDDLDDETEDDEAAAQGVDQADVIKDADLQPPGTWSSRDEQKLFVRVVMGFLGTPYRMGGQSVRGLDCSAFVRKIYDFFEIHLPRTAREQAGTGMTVPRNELQEGDLVFFNTKRAFGHVGIYIGNNEFIHASYKQKQVKVDSLTGYYNKRFVKAVRLKKFDEGV
jgi:peptidoglycan DL-endopeptidase LytE